MASITGVLDLSQIPQDQFDTQFEFRAAVVRNGAVLGSATLSPRARARQNLVSSVVRATDFGVRPTAVPGRPAGRTQCRRPGAAEPGDLAV